MADQGQEHGAGTLEQDFLGHLWPPFTQMQGLKPLIMERAEIYDAINEQMQKLAIYHIFQVANEPAIKLAAKVAGHMAGDLNTECRHRTAWSMDHG